MKTFYRRGLLAMTAALAFGLFATPAAFAAAGTDEQTTIDHAIGTLRDLRHDKEFGNARELINRARGVMIAPRIFKAGFFFGGEGGAAVLLAREGRGWSNPAFYTIASASFGLQIGAQESEMVLIVLTQRGLDALMRDQFKIGANAGIAVATLGSTVEGATTANVGADIVVWASTSGAYAGVSLDGTLIEPRSSANAAYYGHAVTPREIIGMRAPANAGAVTLRRELGAI